LFQKARGDVLDIDAIEGTIIRRYGWGMISECDAACPAGSTYTYPEIPPFWPECGHCPCMTLNAPQTGTITQGIVGVAVYENDYSANLCTSGACEFSSAEIVVWETEALVDEQSTAIEVATGQASTAVIAAEERYEHALEVGNYLICYHEACVALAIAANDVYTVNVWKQLGPPYLLVFPPGSTEPTDDGLFEVPACASETRPRCAGDGRLSRDGATWTEKRVR
jgi:hypothetical protein